MGNCSNCLAAVEKYLPLISADDRKLLLISATCFPFGSCMETERQIIELSEKTDGTLGACCAFADAENNRAMREIEEKELNATVA